MTKSIATLGIVALLSVASSASALVITGQGTTLPGGGSCSIGGVTTTGTGATVTCTGIVLTGHTNVYFGIRNASTVNGNTMTNANATSGSAAVFRNSSTAASQISYTSTTTSISQSIFGTDTVTSTLNLNRTGGTATVTATGGTPANSGNGDIGFLYKITAAGGFTLDVDILASNPDFALTQASNLYDGAHVSTGSGGGERSTVEVGFFWSDCGDSVIDSPEVCDDGGANGTAGSCCTTSCTFKTGGTSCTDSTPTDCKDAQCTGVANVCNQNAGNEANGSSCAGNGTNECSAADTCNASGTCLNNDFSSGTPCTDTSLPGTNSPNQCKDAQCNGTGTCNQTQGNETNGTACADGDFCTSGDTCQAGACASGGGDPCPGPDGDGDCTETCVDTGFEVGNCTGNDPNGSVCADGVFCNGSDTCAGGTCTNHAGDPCIGADGDTDCSESCDEGADNCSGADPDGSSCRPSAGICDVAETCSGGACPSDSVQPVNTVCNAGSADSCDPDEVCDGSGVSCPADTVTPSGTTCRPGSGDVCDPDETCTGTADQPCPPDSFEPGTTVCNAGSGDLCDPDEVCPGVPAGTCAADVIAPPTTVCNSGSGDVCDPDEFCTGMADQGCPSDTVAPSSQLCRGPAGVCDAAENCTGTADQACPADLKEISGTPCRPATGVCDIAETCDGSSDTCPVDVTEPDGQSCSDGAFCNGDETCQSGSCAAGTAPCTFICSESTDQCLTNACPASPTVGCRTSTKKILLVKNKMDNTKDKLIWKFIKGDATTKDDFADPENTAAYALCIYGGTSGALVATAAVPPSNPLWSPIGDKGFKYKDTTGSQSGIQKIILKGGSAGKTKALVKGKGSLLPDPLDSGALGSNVTAQLLNHETGICWSTTFTAPKKDTQDLYKAKQ